jgi:hypothetical protein
MLTKDKKADEHDNKHACINVLKLLLYAKFMQKVSTKNQGISGSKNSMNPS